MNQSRHWAAWMATLMILLGLAILPREGAAWSRYIDPIEPILFGDPDIPDQHARQVATTERLSASLEIYLPVVMFIGGPRVFYFYLPVWGGAWIMKSNGPPLSGARIDVRATSR